MLTAIHTSSGKQEATLTLVGVEASDPVRLQFRPMPPLLHPASPFVWGWCGTEEERPSSPPISQERELRCNVLEMTSAEAVFPGVGTRVLNFGGQTGHFWEGGSSVCLLGHLTS